ncbi:MAG: hypothetical protein V4710_19925 [Verrucomicrobiota bacterium]
MKTVRFSQVVEKCGQPEAYTLWVAPETDKKLQSALRQHRVMSVHQEVVGSRKDYGEVGLASGKHHGLLLFPRSLKAFEGCRVVGLKYDLLASAEPAKSPAPAKEPRKQRPAKKAPPPRLELIAFEPPVKQPAKPKAPKSSSQRNTDQALESLSLAVRRAMKELQAGKTVAAYQTLEKGLGKSAG